MLQSASLQVPAAGKGRSRFSKALPAIPGLNTSNIEPPPPISSPPKAVASPVSASAAESTPELRSDLPPPPTPLANNDPRTPIQYTPLPPIPGTKKTPSPPISSPAPASMSISTTMTQMPTTTQAPTIPKTAMVIPRRPVGGSKTPSVASPPPVSQQFRQPQPPHQSQPSLSKSLPQPRSPSPPQVAPPPQPASQQAQPQYQPPPQAGLPPKPSYQIQPSLSKPLPAPQRDPDSQQPSLVQTQSVSTKPFAPTPTPVQAQSQPPQPPLKPAHQGLPSQSRVVPQVQPQQQQIRANLEVQTQPRPEPVQQLPPRERQPSLSKPLPQLQPSPQEQRAPQLPPLTHQAKLSLSQSQPTPKTPVPRGTGDHGQSLPTQSIDGSNQQQLPPFLPSPSESLSSLLSAYSRSSTESIVRSSDGTFSARESGTNESVHNYAYPAPEEHNRASTPSTVTNTNINGFQLKQTLPRKPIADGSPATPTAAPSPPPPSPPSKDQPGAQRPSSPPQNPAMISTPALATASPPRPQIWRRRSLKGSKDLPDLKLDYSHGSTATFQPAGVQSAQQQTASGPGKSATQQHQKSFSGIIGLPGRNVRPGPPQEQPAESPSIMGHGASKLKQLKDRFHPSRRSKDETTDTKKPEVSGPAPHRPPTPEYQKDDVKTPILDTVVSPISPASSPEPHMEVSPELVGHQLPPIASKVEEPAPPSKTLPPIPAVQPTTSLPDVKSKAPAPVREPVPPTSVNPPPGRNSPAPESSGPVRGRQREAAGPPGPRDNSARPDSRNQIPRPDSRSQSVRPGSRNGSARPDNRRPYPGPDAESRFVRSSSGELLYRGRDGTLYPEMKELQEPKPEAARFPMPAAQPMPEGTIIKARPLRDGHYSCFQRHRSMIRRNNTRCPLSCQTCDKQDAEDRWSCTFCHLRICESCLGIFEANKRDLQSLVNDLGRHRTLSLSSPTRPGSALGLRNMK